MHLLRPLQNSPLNFGSVCSQLSTLQFCFLIFPTFVIGDVSCKVPLRFMDVDLARTAGCVPALLLSLLLSRNFQLWKTIRTIKHKIIQPFNIEFSHSDDLKYLKIKFERTYNRRKSNPNEPFLSGDVGWNKLRPTQIPKFRYRHVCFSHRCTRVAYLILGDGWWGCMEDPNRWSPTRKLIR